MGWLQDHGWIVVVAALALGGLAWWTARRRRPAPAVPGAAARRRVDLAFALAVLVTLVVGLVAVYWLLDQANQLAGKEQAAAQADAIRTGATIALGTGGAAYLLLAYRRQRLEEVDTRERRITELYTKAVEQLGDGKAPVRLGALYSLERLAQNNPEHRQTVIDVVCAYLRMPYTPPTRNDPVPTRWAAPSFSAAGRGRPAVPAAGQGPNQEELQVRQTAQRILAAHLLLPPQINSTAAQRRRPSPRQGFWPGISLDLTGAALVDVDFEQLSVIQARFDGATFQGRTVFDRATFQGDAGFDGATFQGITEFSSATFQGDARFGWAIFHGLTAFSSAAFQHSGWFANASFQGDASFGLAKFKYCVFDGATFQGDAGFNGATFQGDAPLWARFNDAVFQRGANFVNAAFQGGAQFNKATFRGDAGFDRAVFQGDASFGTAKFEGEARFGLAKFEGDAVFHRAKFQGVGLVRRDDEFLGLGPGFKGAIFQGAAWFAEAIFTSSKGVEGVAGAIVLHLDDPNLNKRRVWPDGCTVHPDPTDPSRGTVVRAERAEEPGQPVPHGTRPADDEPWTWLNGISESSDPNGSGS